MVNNDSDAIVEKIKSLLRLADNQAGLPEGELAAKMAEKIMRQHAISQEDLVEKEQILQFPVEVGRSNWKRILLYNVGIFCSCKSWIVSGTRIMQIAGHESDLQIAAYLFDLIKTQIEHQCNLVRRNKSDANNFRRSAVAGVAAKLNAIKNASRAEDQTGTALVLSRYREVENWVALSNRLRDGKSAGYRHDSAGYQAGQNVRLSAGIGSKGSPAGIGPAAKQIKG